MAKNQMQNALDIFQGKAVALLVSGLTFVLFETPARTAVSAYLKKSLPKNAAAR
jgi:hypothetical protein